MSFPRRTLLHGVSITNLGDNTEGGGRTCRKGVGKLREVCIIIKGWFNQREFSVHYKNKPASTAVATCFNL
jgi:hypothetical protein